MEKVTSATQAISDTAATATTQRYYPYGAQRGGGEVNTPYQYTGQKWEENDALEVYYYKARWYDPALRRFLQPDTIVPGAGNPQNLNRYSYVLNNPLARNDPTGYRYEESAGYVADPYYWYDLQYWTVQQLNANAVLWEFGFINDLLYAGSMASAYYIPYVPQATTATAMNEFYQLVCDQSPTDYKQAMEKRFGESIRLGNKWFEYSTLGNTAYGFDAADSGIAPWLAHAGAGFAQLQDYLLRDGDPPGPWYLAFDSVDDYYAVELGYEIYEKGYAPDNKLTVLELNSLLTDYQHLGKLQFRTGPDGQKAANPAWPYSSGDFDGAREPWPAFLFPSFQ